MTKTKHRTPYGTRYHPAYGRIMTHEGYATRIFWNTAMLDYLRRHYPTTLNEELAGCLGVSLRTLVRKARELGLVKDPAWLTAVWNERLYLANAAYRRKGNPGGFKKGVRSNPDGEFKPGHKESPEAKKKRIKRLRRWYMTHPTKARAKALKAAETRRANRARQTSLSG